MARNVKWLADEAFPGEKIALWAHNGHVAGTSSVLGWKIMGQHLRETFGDKMRILGFTFDRGEVRARHPKDVRVEDVPLVMKVPTAKPGSLEEVLRATGMPRLILDLRALPSGSRLADWLGELQTMRTVGAEYDPDNAVAHYSPLVLPRAFDALVYIRDTTASVPMK
jgi:erythromycin esterase